MLFILVVLVVVVVLIAIATTGTGLGAGAGIQVKTSQGAPEVGIQRDIALIDGKVLQRRPQPRGELSRAVRAVVKVGDRTVQTGPLDDDGLDLGTELSTHHEQVGGRECIGSLGFEDVLVAELLVESVPVG